MGVLLADHNSCIISNWIVARYRITCISSHASDIANQRAFKRSCPMKTRILRVDEYLHSFLFGNFTGSTADYPCFSEVNDYHSSSKMIGSLWG